MKFTIHKQLTYFKSSLEFENLNLKKNFHVTTEINHCWMGVTILGDFLCTAPLPNTGQWFRRYWCINSPSNNINLEVKHCYIDSLTPVRCCSEFEFVILKHILWIGISSTSCEIDDRWMARSAERSTSIKTKMAPSHYRNQGWQIYLIPYDITRPQWVKDSRCINKSMKMLSLILLMTFHLSDQCLKENSDYHLEQKWTTDLNETPFFSLNIRESNSKYFLSRKLMIKILSAKLQLFC